MVGGAIVIPALACAIGMAYLGTHLREQLQSWRPKIERISVLLLISVWISNVGQLVSCLLGWQLLKTIQHVGEL